MYALQEQKWGELSVYTWEDLSSHQWICFRDVLMDTVSEMELDLSEVNMETATEMEAKAIIMPVTSVIFNTKTEMIANIVVSERDYKRVMLDYLPWYEKESIVFDSLLSTYDGEFRKLEQDLEVTKRNMFIDTSVEALSVYERDLGIRNISKLGYDQRREQISSRYWGVLGQTTESHIKTIASSYDKGEVKIEKTLVDGIYEISFVGIGIPHNLEGLREAIDIVIPAHIQIDYVFKFIVWGELLDKTWGEVANKTWQELMEGDV